MKNLKTAAQEKGFVLMAVYMVVIFVALFSFVFFLRHQMAVQATERYQNRILAFNGAESGIDSALRIMAIDAGIRGTPPSAVAAGTPPYYTSPITTLNQNAFRYKLSFVPDHPQLRRVDAEGYAPTFYNDNDPNKPRAYQKTNITVYAQITEPAPPGSLFEYGIYTKHLMNLLGMTFDSYNSSQGAYGGSNISGDGAVAADSPAIAVIALTSTTVKGSAEVGETGNPATGITITNSVITGTKGTLPSGWTLPSPPSLDSTPHTEIDLSNVSKDKTLSEGTYHTSSIHVSGKANLITTGKVRIYVDGAVDITGQGTTVAANKPGNLHIYVLGSEPCKIRGNGSFYGGIFAPNSDVTFQTSNSGKGGTWFGAVVAKTFSTFGGGAPAFHFDLAMKETQAPDPNQIHVVRVTAWQETNSLAWGTGTVE